MMNFQNYILNEISYLELFVLTLLYFLFLYFGIAPIFKRVCEWLEQKEFLVKIINKQVQKSQIKKEIKNSLSSIFVFGFSSLPLIFLYRLCQVSILENTFINVIFGLIILNIWNEVHFYIIHKSLHHPFLMRNVHHIHHKSIIPTVYSIYSFHWIEALLLSSVPLTIVPFVSFSPVAIFLYPFSSALLNYAGHCNFRLKKWEKYKWMGFATKHNGHHFRYENKFGFASNILDKLFNK